MIQKFPPRQQNELWSLTEREMDAIDYSLISNKPRGEIYNIFCAPQATATQCRTKASALWSSRDAREYIEIRTKQMDKTVSEETEKDAEIWSQDFTKKFTKIIKDNALDASSEIQVDAIRIAAAQVFKDTSGQTEAPRRYLAENCYQGPCRYLAYCELALVDGCQYCRYRKFTEEHGVFYDHKNQLDIPEDDPLREIFEPRIVDKIEDDPEKKNDAPEKKKAGRPKKQTNQ